MQNPFSAIQGVSSLNQASQMNSLNAPSSVGSVGSISTSLPSISAPSESDAKSFSNLLGLGQRQLHHASLADGD